MGNIKTLSRDSGSPQLYTYTGNRLSSITGGLVRSYSYDANGNVLSDGSSTLSYNDLNLPVTVSGTATISYTYDASGRKLRMVNGSLTRDYLEGIEYAGGTIELIRTEEGLARKDGSSYSYEYSLSDHLGNSRLSFDVYSGAAREIQHDDYYPFGKTFNSYVLGARNNYLYNGKELQGGLGQYDYGARFYDPLAGRFGTIDPLAENGRRFSPYVYGNNSPIRYIDPDGMWSIDSGGNQTTSDFSEISSFITGFKSSSGLNNSQNLLSSSSPFFNESSTGTDQDDPPSKKKKKKSSFIVFGDKFETSQTRKGIDDGLLDANITQYHANELGKSGTVALFSFLPSSLGALLSGAESKVSGELDGSFSVFDWSGYPPGGIKPKGPFKLIEGAEYSSSRDLANSTNSAIRKTDPDMFRGLQIHEIHPVKFGGSPTNVSNKILLTPIEHAQYTNFWNSMMRSLK